MQKEEFYNSTIELYRKTGQGCPGFIRIKMDNPEIIDELIKEGKLKSITHHYSYLPDDEKLCLIGVYCVEEEMEKGGVYTRALDFLRRYMGIPMDAPFKEKVEEFFKENPEEKVKYDELYNNWLTEHKDELERSFSSLDSMKMQIPSTPSKLSIDKDFLEYINGFNLDSSINEMESLCIEEIFYIRNLFLY